MKQAIITFILICIVNLTFSQEIISGEYDLGLKLSFDSITKRVTGYFEDFSGWDEKTKDSRFSCVFYIEGVMKGQKFTINTYSPKFKKEDVIQGTIEIINDKKIKIKLSHEHGGCWNVEHFTEEPVTFTLEKSQKWFQIKYIDTAKAFLHSDKFDNKQLKSYLVKGDFVCIDKIEEGWAHCIYFGKKTTKGWLKLSDLNKFE